MEASAMKINWAVVSLAVTLGGLVLGAAGSAAVLAYRVNQLEKVTAAQTEQMRALDRSVQELNITMRLRGGGPS
jgi:hypothetical protein